MWQGDHAQTPSPSLGPGLGSSGLDRSFWTRGRPPVGHMHLWGPQPKLRGACCATLRAKYHVTLGTDRPLGCMVGERGGGAMAVSLDVVALEKPEDVNVIVGQAHFIKTVEDLHEALTGVSPHLRFGIAFCEASTARLIRRSGND